MIDNYHNTLAIYGYEMLPRYCSPKAFHNRIDSLMLLICRQCFNLHTLVGGIRFNISTEYAFANFLVDRPLFVFTLLLRLAHT